MKRWKFSYSIVLTTLSLCTLSVCHPSVKNNTATASSVTVATSTSDAVETPKQAQIHRYELAFMNLDTAHLETAFKQLQATYPVFIEGADISKKEVQNEIKSFIADERAKEILADIKKQYPNFKAFENTLFDGLDRYVSTFHEGHSIPDVYTYLSYLDYENRVIFQDSLLIIGIDMYLGANYKHYTDIAIPVYISARLGTPNLVPDALRAVANYELGQQQPLRTMLDHLILQGKVAYFLSQMLPKTDEWLYFGYNKSQWQWCKKHETMMWAYFIKEKLLFEEDYFKIRKFIDESPTITLFPESPGRVGWFIGYQIVKRYMDKTNQTLPGLFRLHDSQSILSQSGYRP